MDAQLREGCSGQSPSSLGHGAAPAGQRTRHGRTESQNISPLKSIPRQISPSPTPTAGQDFSKDEVPSEAQKVWVSPPPICLVCFSSRIFYITKRNPEAPVGEKEKLRAALVRTASGPFSVLFLLPSPRGISAFTLKKHDLVPLSIFQMRGQMPGERKSSSRITQGGSVSTEPAVRWASGQRLPCRAAVGTVLTSAHKGHITQGDTCTPRLSRGQLLFTLN